MKLIKIFLLVFPLILLLSCKKDDSQIITKNGVLSWTGDYAVDGCGFFITIEGSVFKPENETFIDDSFKTYSSIAVTVGFERLDKKIQSFCGDLPQPTMTDGIKIITITKN